MESVIQNTLLRDLAVVMIVAGVVTLIFHRLRQPVVLGYILAGLIIGPHTPPFPLIRDEGSIATLSELGVVFLMFSLGLEFRLRQLRQVGTAALTGAVVEILAMLWVGYQLGQVFGWGRMDSLFLGAILCISSTTITVKVLAELGLTKTAFARLSFGILIVEDILAIALIALLSSVAVTGTLAAGQVLTTLLQIGVFLSVTLIVGLLAVPRLLRYVARFNSNEMMLVTVLGLCFGVSLLAVKLEYSVALGAFLIGTIIGEAREAGRIKTLTEPVRDMFSAVFFVAIGMAIDPVVLQQYAWPTAVITLAVVVGKILSRFFGVLVAGHDTRTSLRVGMTLAQIGEFSFIIAALGVTLKVTSGFLYPIAVSVSVITTLLTPYLIRSADGAVNWFDRIAPGWLVNSLALYSQWLARARQGSTHSQARLLARKWVLQMAVNIALVTAAFTAAATLAERAPEWWPALQAVPGWIGGAKGLLWIAAAVVALPALIATVRKLQAFALLLAELCCHVVEGDRQSVAMRGIVAQVVFLGGTVVLGLWVLLLSATLLPFGPALLVVLLIVAILAGVFWRFFIQIHARAQVALRETLNAPVGSDEEDAEAPIQRLFRDARLATIEITQSCPAANKLIRELELRTKTGASVVAIERGETSVINPGPDEELHPEDRVLLLGTPGQLEAGRHLFSGPAMIKETT